MAKRTLIITYVASYLLAIGSILRLFLAFHESFLFEILILNSIFLSLLILEPICIRKYQKLNIIYLFIQISVILIQASIFSDVDFWTPLFLPLIIQVMQNYSQKVGYIFTTIISLITSFFLIQGIGFEQGFPIALILITVFFLTTAFIAIIREAIRAREESQLQKAKLEEVNQQLRTYANRAGELAVLKERNRLARELHDSITQSLHSSTLLAEAGKRLMDTGEFERVKNYLERLGQISLQSLKEMRLLVHELRPFALRDVGLIQALKQRLETVEVRSGIEVSMDLDEKITIPEFIEEELYPIAIEALNNALKHAKSTHIEVILDQIIKEKSKILELTIKDNGIGFDQEKIMDQGGLGLISMQERAKKLGGAFLIESAPGGGTIIRISVKNKMAKPQEES